MLLATELDNFIDRYLAAYAAAQVPLVTEHQDEWQAPIYRTVLQDDWVEWQPVRQSAELQFHDLAHALEQPFHADLETYYGRWYAADLYASYADHPLLLLQNYCAEDGQRLQANLAGHVLMKRRLRQPLTCFIGLAEESDDLLISVDNDTGNVGLEFVGRPQHEILAPSLAQFLRNLTPRVVNLTINE